MRRRSHLALAYIPYLWVLLAALYLREYAKQGTMVRIVRIAVNNLAGVPSVVFGLFGLAFFVTWLEMGVSILAGCLTLAVMSLPVLSGLIDLFPTAQVTVLAAPRVAPLFVGQPGVTKILPYPAGQEKWRFLLNLRSKFDLAVALPNSLESALGLWLTRTPHRLGYAANGRTPLLTLALKGRKHLQGVHQVFYYLGLLQGFAPVRDFLPPRLFLSEVEQTQARKLLQGNGHDTGALWIGLAPGAAYGPAKRWPAERFAQVGDLLQQEYQAGLVLLGGPADREAADEVQRHGRGKYLNLAGKTTLRQALMILGQLKVLITNDSAPMHVAVALHTPVIALFGPTAAERLSGWRANSPAPATATTPR